MAEESNFNPIPISTTDVEGFYLNNSLQAIEDNVQEDALLIYGPLLGGMDSRVRIALDSLDEKKENLFVVVDTPGGVVEVVERIVRTMRHHYDRVTFAVPDRAMSAGTVLVLSGDSILMDYHSCLGPIDPQIERADGTLVPALSYLEQYERLMKKEEEGILTTADVVLLEKLELAELHKFELAKDLSISLIKNWLVEYKFRNWERTETRGLEVTDQMKQDRAKEIAELLNAQKMWMSHGRGIHMDTLKDVLGLKIDDYEEKPELRQQVWNYLWFARGHANARGYRDFVHSRTFR